MVDTLVVFGVGLIGGSFALACRRAGLVKRVIGVGRSRDNLEAARDSGVIDEIAQDAAVVADADVVALAVPVGSMGAVMADIAPYLSSKAVITDMGSTKQDVVEAARLHLGPHLARFVPGHPIAGAERSGVTAARDDLFRGRTVVLTPLAETDPAARERVAMLWMACGAEVVDMSPEHHDSVFALVSHLPHVLAFALVDFIAGKPDAEMLFSFAAGGFRDFTRIAESSPEMWRDICLANRHALLAQMAGYAEELTRITALIDAADGEGLAALFTRAREARRRFLKNG